MGGGNENICADNRNSTVMIICTSSKKEECTWAKTTTLLWITGVFDLVHCI
jgi:hypothetical protein